MLHIYIYIYIYDISRLRVELLLNSVICVFTKLSRVLLMTVSLYVGIIVDVRCHSTTNHACCSGCSLGCVLYVGTAPLVTLRKTIFKVLHASIFRDKIALEKYT